MGANTEHHPWRWLVDRGEMVAFWLLVGLHLVPLWAFPYLPTQDGPSHLENALILRDYGSSSIGYEQLFELREEPLPNLTSHVLLAALVCVVAPLVAEKLLVSLYVLSFAGSYRFFLGAYGPRCRPLAWVGLLFVYNRCLWMGFYNYCLSLIPLWLALGLCVRWRGKLDLPRAAVLMLLFALAYFTHLAGFLLALAGALLASVTVAPRQRLAPLLILLAALPAACLAFDYFEQTGFHRARSAMNIVHDPLARLLGDKDDVDPEREMEALYVETLAHHARSTPFAAAVFAYLTLLSAVGLISRRSGAEPGWLFPALFSLLLLAGFMLVPQHLGIGHGGYLKMRLAPLPTLVWLACLREPAWAPGRWSLRGLTALLLALNLALVYGTVGRGNAELAEFTSGLDAVGSGHRLHAIYAQPHPPPLVDHFLHAPHYYCLDNGNMCVDNYEATTMHFPVKYRPGVRRGSWLADPSVDTVLCWDTKLIGRAAVGWEQIFQRGSLWVYRRVKEAPK